jgi:hypothetical protein
MKPYVRKLGEDAVEAQSHRVVAVILTVTATMRDWAWARRMSRLATPMSFRVNLQTGNEVIRMRAQRVGSDVIAETNEADVHPTQDHGASMTSTEFWFRHQVAWRALDLPSFLFLTVESTCRHAVNV